MTRDEGSQPPDPRIDELIKDYRQARHAGDEPDRQELIARNPDLSGPLQAFFTQLDDEDRSAGKTPQADAELTAEWDSENPAGSTSAQAPTWPPSSGQSSRGAAQAKSNRRTVDAGTTVGEFHVLREIGRGGMGVVYEAEQIGSGRRLALKLLAPNLPRTTETVERFLREASVAASLSHPRSTFIYGAGEVDGQFYIAMELMPGKTLRDLVDSDGPLPSHRAVDYILDVLEGLQAAHATGVVHRDVKPSNCFLDSDQRVKVGDYGLSKSLVADTELTRTGAFMGTPQFAAPEQVRGGNVDQRTDVFAVGATLFYLIAGRAPFVGDAAAVIAQIVADQPPPLRSLSPHVPKALDRIVARTLEKDPQRRYGSSKELRQALLPFATGGTSIADIGRRVAAYCLDATLVSCGAALAGSLALVVYMLSLSDPSASDSRSMGLGIQLLVCLALVAYFAITEGLWGRGVGKRLLGLRVLDLQGQAPGVPRALLRALIFPGVALVPSLILQFTLSFRLPTDSSMWEKSILVPQAYVAIGWVLSLLCASTMRAQNGHRGLHELASGTHVVWPRTGLDSTQTLCVPVVVPLAATPAPPSMGPFRVIGQLGTCGGITVWKAYDDSLQRPVWIYCREGRETLDSAARIGVARPTRQHWLQRGETDQRSWEAYEAIEGAPLADCAREEGGLSWPVCRRALLDLAEELAASLANATVPSQLELEQVWIDQSGRLKLLDIPLASPDAQSRSTLPVTSTDAERALRLFRAVARLCSTRELLPSHAVDFFDQLHRRPAEGATFAWAIEQLRTMIERPSRLRWDDRLGILAISWGIESTVYWGLATTLAFVLWTIPQLPLGICVSTTALSCLAVAAVLGFWFRGGPVFWLANIEVRRSNNRSASQLQCAWRTLVAWTPVILGYALMGMMMVTFSQALVYDGNAEWRLSADADRAEFGMQMAGFALSSLFLGIIHLVGAVYAIVRPRRGLQDLLAGTYLVPR